MINGPAFFGVPGGGCTAQIPDGIVKVTDSGVLSNNFEGELPCPLLPGDYVNSYNVPSDEK